MSVWALLMDNLRRGTVTLRFPTRPPTCNRYRGLVHINTEPCKCCGICAVVCTSAAITMKKGDGKYEWNYDAGQCTFCGRCVDSCALKLLTMEAAPLPIYEKSGALKQSYSWEAKTAKAPVSTIVGSKNSSEPVALSPENKTSPGGGGGQMNDLHQISSVLGLSETWEEKNGSWWIAPAALDIRLMAAVMRSHEARFVTLTAMQLAQDAPTRLDYHWDINGQLLTFTTYAQGNQVPSIVDLCEAADWVERETHENFSIDFTGHDYEPLLLRAGDASGLQLRKEAP